MYHCLNIFITVDDQGNPEGMDDLMRSAESVKHIAGQIAEGYREGEVLATRDGTTLRGYWHTESKTT